MWFIVISSHGDKSQKRKRPTRKGASEIRNWVGESQAEAEAEAEPEVRMLLLSKRLRNFKMFIRQS